MRRRLRRLRDSVQSVQLKLGRALRWMGLSALCGVLAGGAAAIFLLSLDVATDARNAHPQIIWLLPLAGFAVGWLYHHFGASSGGGSNLILEEIHDPRNTLPVRMAPFVLVGTLLTHLFGGSAGREGTAVQMGATLSDQLSRFFKIEKEERKILLVAGAGAGFGAAIGAPWAGAIFGMEVVNIGGLRLFAWLECLIASFVGYETCAFVGAHHSRFPTIEIPGFDPKTALFVAIAGAAFGLAALLFVRLTHVIERVLKKLFPYSPLKPFAAGCLIVGLYWLEGTYRFAGLGIPIIQDSFAAPSSFAAPALKAVFTALTVGSGFKGGEFVPLVFIGATFGSALSLVLPVAIQLLAGLGFSAVFAGAANTPIACTLMAAEIFGWPILPYALIACFASYYCSGHHGIYGAQKVHGRKHARALAAWTKVSSWRRA